LTIALRASRFRIAATVVGGIAALTLFSGCTAEAQAEAATYVGINAIRAQHGLPALTPDPTLLNVARARSRDMAARGYFSHSPPDGCNYTCLLHQQGVLNSWVAENIAWNENYTWPDSAQNAVDLWRNSPPHMANITNCHFERFATGVARAADGRIYYTMIFEGSRAC
jgi:uncharacterized protein YkwD